MNLAAAHMVDELSIAEAHVAAEAAKAFGAASTLPAPTTPAPAAPESYIYRIPTCRFAELEAKVVRLARRAAKMGVPAPSLTKVGTDRRPILNEAGTKIIGYLELSLVTVSGEAPKFAGWTFLARLERLPGAAANIIHRIVDSQDLPAELRTSKPKCDHCKLARTRKDTFVVGHEDGRVLQVGSSCLADFLGHASPESLAAQCSYLIELRNALDEDESWGAGCGVPDAFALSEYLSWVSVAIRTCGGWLSRSAAYERGQTEQSTASVAWTLMTMCDAERREQKIELPSFEDAERGRLATEWGQKVEPTSDYLHNLRTIALSAMVSLRSAGLAASLLPAYDRELGHEAERKARAARPVCNEYFGTVGERLRGLQLEVVLCRDIASDFGEKYLIGFEDAEGRSFKWWSTSGRLDVGTKYTVTGTVKKHDEYKGRKATTLSRCDAATQEELLEREARAEKAREEAEAKKSAWKVLKKELLLSGEAIELKAIELCKGMFLAESFSGETLAHEQTGSLQTVRVTTETGYEGDKPKTVYVTRSLWHGAGIEGKTVSASKKMLVRVVGCRKPEEV